VITVQCLQFLLLILLAFPSPLAHAAKSQTDFDLNKGNSWYRYHVEWKDGDGDRDEVDFTVAAKRSEKDLDARTRFSKQAAAEFQAKAVKKYAKTLGKSVKLKASAKGGVVRISASGTDLGKVQSALREARAVQREAFTEYLEGHHFFEIKPRTVSWDHAKLAAAYADDVAPLAVALAEETDDDREFAERALSFVQAIPYEKRETDVYRKPMAVLARNKGDCDSKSVLYLALLRAHDPDLPLTAIYIKNHMLVGVGLDKEVGDKAIRRKGQRYLYAEPAGPAQLPVGDSPAKHRSKVAAGKLRVVP
jgi:Transglutaminase-like superfamily